MTKFFRKIEISDILKLFSYNKYQSQGLDIKDSGKTLSLTSTRVGDERNTFKISWVKTWSLKSFPWYVVNQV